MGVTPRQRGVLQRTQEKSDVAISYDQPNESSEKDEENAAEENRVEEEGKSVRKRRSTSPQKNKRSSKTEDPVLQAGQYLKGALAVVLVVIFFVDWAALGLSAGSTPFIDWWDMIGTVAYLRGRHEQYSLRSKKTQKSPSWSLYVVLNAFLLYVIAGKLCRTIMRKTAVLPSLMGFLDFVVYGIIPVHFCPGDYLWNVVEKDDIQQLIVSAFWGLTKVRSLHGVMKEAVHVHKYSFPQAFVLCILSCEIASVVSRIDKNVTRFSPQECARRFPGGLKAWLTARSFWSSIVISVFMCATMMSLKVPVVWLVPNFFAFLACFYRYANGLLERVVAKYVSFDHLDVKHSKQVEEKLLVLGDRLNAQMRAVPHAAAALPHTLSQESIKVADSLRTVMDKIATDSKDDLGEAAARLQDLSDFYQHGSTKRNGASTETKKEKTQ